MLAQRRHVDVEDVEAVVEIVAQLAAGDGLFGILVGRGEDADVDRGLGLLPRRRSLRSSRTRSSLAWVATRHLADLVEQERAAVGQLEAAGAALEGAGERALLVAEDFAFDQAFRGCAAQLMATKGLRLRGLRSWMVRATSSLPVPLSPVMRTEAVLGATSSMRWKISCILFEAPTREPSTPAIAQLAAGDLQLALGAALAGGVLQDVAQACGIDGLLDEVVGAQSSWRRRRLRRSPGR